MAELSDEQFLRKQRIGRMLCERKQRWDARQLSRIHHLFRAPEADPVVARLDEKGNRVPNDNKQNALLFQHIRPLRDGQRLVSRLSENHWLVDVKAPDKANQGIKSAANDTAAILNAWGLDIEERTRRSWQNAMSWGQCTSYAVLHYRRCEDLWPDLEYQWKDDQPEEGDKRFAEYYDETKGTTRYREKGDAYMERRNRAYAKAGAPWHVQFIDPLNFAFEEDNDPRGGLKRALFHYDVSLLEYEDAAGHDNEGLATEILTAAPAPGIESGDAGVTGFSTPTSGDFPDRIHVYQLWERDTFTEWTSRDTDKAGAGSLRKHFKHEYGRVPVCIVPAWDTNDPDAMRRYVGALENVLEVKPWWDYVFSNMADTLNKNANPEFTRENVPGKTPLLAEDGNPQGDAAGSVAGAFGGQNLKQIAVNLPPGLGPVLQQVDAMFAEASPDTGHAEIGASTAPWSARLAQSQANVEPRLLILQQAAALQWLFTGILDWHAAHTDMPMVAYGRDDDGHPDRSKVIVVQPDNGDGKGVDFEQFSLAVSISPTSSAEQITTVEHKMTWARPGQDGSAPFITREDVYRDMGIRDPQGYQRSVEAEQIIAPLRQQIIKAQVDYEFASTARNLIYGQNGEILSVIDGQQMDPRQVLQQRGWQPAMGQPNSAGGVPAGATQTPPQGMPQPGGPGVMPPMPALGVPGQTAIPGVTG